jgi:hypothetical protein
MQTLMEQAVVQPAFALADAAGKPPVGIELHRFRNGGVTILGLHTNPQLRVDELGPPEFKSNERFEKPQTVSLTFPSELFAVDLRKGKSLGRHSQMTFTVDSYEPTLIALSSLPPPELHLSAPATAARGETILIGMNVSRAAADRHVFRVECIGPDGKIAAQYSGNRIAENGVGAWAVPLAVNDPTGRWTMRVTDVLSGTVRSAGFDVR